MKPNFPKLTQVCEHCLQPYPNIDAPKHKDGKCNETCVNCAGPMHPCISCNEMATINGNYTDAAYFDLIQLILEEGRIKKNRTGVNTIGVFGAQAKFDVRMDAFPILTTKKVWFKGIVHELLWFISGSTNIKYLVDNDVHIWDEWAYARYAKTPLASLKEWDMHEERRHFTQDEFISKIKACELYNRDMNNWTMAQFAIVWGDLGEGTYGSMWRHFPCYENANLDPQVEYVDQLKKVIETLKTNPDDRRMIVSAWNPYLVDSCALPPCHVLLHFNTEEPTLDERIEIVRQRNPGVSTYDGMGGLGSLDIVAKETGWSDAHGVPKRRVNLLLYQRSLDASIGGPFNFTSYSLLLAMVAHCVGMEPGEFTWSIGDCHVYENQIPMVKEQLTRTPRVLPKLRLNPDVKDLFSFRYEDIKLIGYDPHPAIKMPVAV
jgi:thymidylate synthase